MPGIFSVGMDVHRDPAPVVHHLDRIVVVDGDFHAVGVAGQRFIDRVVDDLVDEVVKSALRRGANVHAGTFPNRLQPFQYLDLPGVVLRRIRRWLRHFTLDSAGIHTPNDVPKLGRPGNLYNLT